MSFKFAILHNMLSILFSVFSSIATATTPTELSMWLNQQSFGPEPQAIFSLYPNINSVFFTEITKWTRNQLNRSAQAALKNFQSDICNESSLFKALEASKITPSAGIAEQNFVNSIILIESAYCIPSVTLEKAFTVFMSPEFRMDVMPHVDRITPTPYGHCVESSGITGILLPSTYCVTNKIRKSHDAIIVHSSLFSVEQGSAYQPLYYREEVLVFSTLSTGVGLYRATFTRSDDLGVTSKYILRTTLDSSQTSIREGYVDWLQR